MFQPNFLILLISLWSSAAFGFDHVHTTWSAVLKLYRTVDARVRYAELKNAAAGRHDHPFNVYIAEIQQVPKRTFETWTRDEQKAFLLNAYNALTVRLILDHYPTKSIRDIGGIFQKPWSIEFFSLLGGAAKSLDVIEHELLRPVYRDYRVHSAVNCASVSCPELRGEAYVGSRLNEQLDDQMRRWLADTTRNQFDGVAGKFKISKIFDWYQRDFDSWGGGVKKVLATFAPAGSRSTIQKGGDIQYLDYDWNLNEAK